MNPYEKNAEILRQIREIDAGVLNNRSRLSAMLADMLNGDKLTRNMLLMAFDEGIAEELEAGKGSESDLSRYRKTLKSAYGLTDAVAYAAVASWCAFFGIDPGKECPEAMPAPEPPAVQWIDTDDDSYSYEAMEGGIRLTKFVGFDEPEIAIPNMIKGQKVLALGDSVFQNCISIKSVQIPDGVESIGDSAFEGCSALARVRLPDTLRTIGEQSFQFCIKLAEIDFPDTLKSIGKSAFSRCRSLLSVVLPDSVETIGESAFEDCMHLKTVYLPAGLQTLEKNSFFLCWALENVRFPEVLKSIGDGAFDNLLDRQSELKKIVLPEGLESIGRHAFARRKGMGSIYIPASVTSIADNAFSECGFFTILCHSNTYALAYAREHSIRCKPAEKP